MPSMRLDDSVDSIDARVRSAVRISGRCRRKSSCCPLNSPSFTKEATLSAEKVRWSRKCGWRMACAGSNEEGPSRNVVFDEAKYHGLPLVYYVFAFLPSSKGRFRWSVFALPRAALLKNAPGRG